VQVYPFERAQRAIAEGLLVMTHMLPTPKPLGTAEVLENARRAFAQIPPQRFY
jgi:hypothetical protein